MFNTLILISWFVCMMGIVYVFDGGATKREFCKVRAKNRG